MQQLIFWNIFLIFLWGNVQLNDQLLHKSPLSVDKSLKFNFVPTLFVF